MRDYPVDPLRFLQRATEPLEMPRRPAASRFLKNFPAELHILGIWDGSDPTRQTRARRGFRTQYVRTRARIIWLT
jgi:hypothetical protein